jgi:hypothetical protein
MESVMAWSGGGVKSKDDGGTLVRVCEEKGIPDPYAKVTSSFKTFPDPYLPSPVLPVYDSRGTVAGLQAKFEISILVSVERHIGVWPVSLLEEKLFDFTWTLSCELENSSRVVEVDASGFYVGG